MEIEIQKPFEPVADCKYSDLEVDKASLWTFTQRLDRGPDRIPDVLVVDRSVGRGVVPSSQPWLRARSPVLSRSS